MRISSIRSSECDEQPPGVTGCPVCEATVRSHFISAGGMSLYRCGGCGLVYLDPMPDAGEVAGLYRDAYDGATAGYFAKPASKLARSRRRIRQLARHVGGGRFLDIGCNGGFMVEAARERGFAATGIDLDPVSIAYAREHFPGNAYFCGPVEEFAAAAPFDAVYCSEVIEHVPNVNSFVAAIAALMRPGAVLYLTTPDISHWRRPRDVRRWDAFCPPSHCLYFSPGNLSLLLARHGLETFRRRVAWKPGIKLFARKMAEGEASWQPVQESGVKRSLAPLNAKPASGPPEIA